MIKAHVIKLHPNKTQEKLLKQSCGVARYAFNWALDKWTKFNWALDKWTKDYEKGIKQTAYSLIKHLNSIKRKEFPWMQETSKTCSQYAIHNVENAFKKMWKEKKGYPKFKKKRGKNAFVAIDDKNNFKQKDFKLRLPRIGWIKCAENLRFTGKVNRVTIKNIADMWFAVINIDVFQKEVPVINENQIIIGVDIGIKKMIVLSDGKTFENPKALQKNEQSLKKMQKRLSKKNKDSKNYEKQRIKIAKKHYKISSIRKNSIHQATSYIVKNYDIVCVETLDVKQMLKNKNLSKLISDVSFSEILRQLSYKTQWKNKKLIKADQYFPSSKLCSSCNYKKDNLKLSERTYKCKNCGLEIDRDLNASKNLANYGTTYKSEESKACGAYLNIIVDNKVAMNQEINILNIKNL
jgi:putative transposase